MPEDIHAIPALDRKLMLQQLVNSPAFALFTDAWNEVVVGGVQERINNLDTSDTDTRVLKAVRLELIGTHHPRKIVETLIRKANSELLQPSKKE